MNTDFTPTPELLQREIQAVHSIKFKPDLQKWVDEYSQVGFRNAYIWNWCRRGVEVIGLSCVPEEKRDEMSDAKFLGAMLDVLLDDVADKGGDPAFLDYLLNIPFGNSLNSELTFSEEEMAYARFTGELWDEIAARASVLPRYHEFEDILRFDYYQMFNTMRYSHLVNAQPELLNLTEHDLYLPHNMYMMIFATLDIMCSPTFDRRELGTLREAVLKAQYMGRIGNLVTTWQREIPEQDYSSGVFARAVSEGQVTVDQLLNEPPQVIEKVIREGNNEEYFLEKWQEYRRDLLAMQPRLKTVDLAHLVAGLEKLLCLHLGSRGNK
ncbi:MAG: hypothetical protein Tsb009_25480 [Planctomycetaceae bacterium]